MAIAAGSAANAAGLYIRELLMRADARRILVVAPGGLVEQWRDELFEKFGLEFRVYSRELEAASPSGNPFEDHDHLIVRLDQMSRAEEDQEKLCLASWDLVVFDEAHKLSAQFLGREIKRTKRFLFAEKIGRHTRHLLLMTATPHNGKEEDFQLFLSLLDSDRFYGKFRDARPHRMRHGRTEHRQRKPCRARSARDAAGGGSDLERAGQPEAAANRSGRCRDCRDNIGKNDRTLHNLRMPGKLDQNFRSATLNEDVGVLLLSSFCAVARVPQQQDIGIDVICTLLRRDGSRNLLAEESFYVQIKSRSIDEVAFIDVGYDWFKRLELPYLLARVDAKSGTLELHSFAMSKIHFVEAEYKGIKFLRTPPTESSRDGIRLSRFEDPIATLSLAELGDRAKLERLYEIIKTVVRVEAQNRQLIRLRCMKRLTWITNEVPVENGYMTLVNVGLGTYQLEVIDALLETLRGGLLAFMTDRASMAAVAPLLAHAHSLSRLTKDDRQMIDFLQRMFLEKERLLEEKSERDAPAQDPPTSPPAGSGQS